MSCLAHTCIFTVRFDLSLKLTLMYICVFQAGLIYSTVIGETHPFTQNIPQSNISKCKILRYTTAKNLCLKFISFSLVEIYSIIPFFISCRFAFLSQDFFVTQLLLICPFLSQDCFVTELLPIYA